MNDKLWWLIALLLTCAVSSTEVFICSYDSGGEYTCRLISEDNTFAPIEPSDEMPEDPLFH